MTPKAIEKVLKWAARYSMSPGALGKALTGPPHNLTPADATKLMDQYRREYPIKTWTPLQEPIKNKPAKEMRLSTLVLAPVAATPEPPTRSLALIKRSLVKKLALEASKELRAGKFKRVSGSFLDGVEAALNGVIRDTGKGYRIGETSQIVATEGFVTGHSVKLFRELLNETVVALVRARVQRHPSIGVTLKD